MNVISVFSGAGGMDLGFKNAGFNIVWANEYDKKIWETYEKNHDNFLDRRSILDIRSEEIPDCDGVIGGPPCQSWSIAGNMNGIDDERGKLFYEYIRIINDKQPKFFVAENVPGILYENNRKEAEKIIESMSECGYDVFVELLDAHDYNVPQNRKRVFFVGFRKDLNIKKFNFPKKDSRKPRLIDSIWGLNKNVMPPRNKNKANSSCVIPNHEFYQGSFSFMYMSRNRVRAWNQPSFTIQANGRHIPIHPQAPPMIKVGNDKREFDPNFKHLYRRLSIRECARIQTFPDDFVFYYENLNDGYKMVGNAVPINLAHAIAVQIRKYI